MGCFSGMQSCKLIMPDGGLFVTYNNFEVLLYSCLNITNFLSFKKNSNHFANIFTKNLWFNLSNVSPHNRTRKSTGWEGRIHNSEDWWNSINYLTIGIFLWLRALPLFGIKSCQPIFLKKSNLASYYNYIFHRI